MYFLKAFLQLTLFILISTTVNAQIISDLKKIEFFYKDDFIKRSAEDYYHKANYKTGTPDLSAVILGDTTGLVKNGEYIMYRSPLLHFKQKEAFKYVKKSPVSVNEYQEFMTWVRDSMARHSIFFNLEEDSESNKYLNYEKEFYHAEKEKMVKYNGADRLQNKDLFNLNWNKNFSWEDPMLVPLLNTFYLRRNERFYRKSILDQRKLNYRFDHHYYEFPYFLKDNDQYKALKVTGDYKVINKSNISEKRRRIVFESKKAAIIYSNAVGKEKVFYIRDLQNVAPYYIDWAINANHPFDEKSILSKVYPTHFKEQPIVGILGTQAQAFCHWKEQQINNYLSKFNVNYTAKVTLPSNQDLSAVDQIDTKIETEVNFRDQWRITPKEYQSFIDYVIDSTAIRIVYEEMENDEAAAKLIQNKQEYFGEGILEWIEFDPADRLTNISLFNLNYNKNINRYIKKYCKNCDYKSKSDLINKRILNNNQLIYDWYYIDHPLKAITGKAYDWTPSISKWPFNYSDTTITRFEGKEKTFKLGKDLLLSYTNPLGVTDGLRGHENLNRFIVQQQTNILPKNYKKGGEIDVSSLSYEQAIAFYRWKNKIQNITEKDEWTNFILPSKEEYEAMKLGQLRFKNKIEMELPTPTFRYVIHFYPK
ncbi:hypothetical protein [Brumimicrobium aurantiacum]|uniref:Sulfatase-modifying factor enzyme domain-containing protein n=1 Tax=Brumimicrobium aurantiacum TaxID=1737063 RepID=A0A3E1EWK6_9FLAO|nr:hypothetical protein [Brumimicrobium aurantiacum]RFC53902.1 hypothetical protein DXU93_10160 [Brumimicrobium aurantiacum]